MGETTYVMHPVAYASIYSVREHPKESAMHAALSQSISFGRFMSESLSWERWSTFTSKKYVEEAERFSQPGSVAQKKAFFEAHYKGMSAKKITLAEPNLVVTSSPRNSPRPKLDTIKEEEDQEESNTREAKSSVLLDEFKAVANERAEVEAETPRLHEESEMTFESPNRVTDTYDDQNEKTGEMELNLNELKSNNKENEDKSSEKEEESCENEESFENEECSENEEESCENEKSFENEEESCENEESFETSVLEESDTEVVESQIQLDKQESMKMELNEEPESESPCSEYHSLKQESVCSEEALVGSIEEDSCSSTPINEKITVTESPHKKKSTARWLKPLRVTPAKEFNIFSLKGKTKPNKSRNYAEEVAANVASKYRELTPGTETRASENCTAISESKNKPNGRSPSTTMFKQFWNKCSKKLLISSFKLRNEEKARRKKEKLEKKPRKWGLTHCFKPSPYRKNHKENEKNENHIKLIAMSRPYAAKSSKDNHYKGKTELCNDNGSD